MLVQRKDIPEWLHESELYKTLQDDESSIEVSIDCYKQTTDIYFRDDFIYLHKTCNFWCTKFPNSFYLYISFNYDEDFTFLELHKNVEFYEILILIFLDAGFIFISEKVRRFNIVPSQSNIEGISGSDEDYKNLILLNNTKDVIKCRTTNTILTPAVYIFFKAWFSERYKTIKIPNYVLFHKLMERYIGFGSLIIVIE